MNRNILLTLITGSVSLGGQTFNNQINGVTFTNRLVSLSDDSAISHGANRATGLAFLTDDDVFTGVYDAGVDTDLLPISGGALEGAFNGPIAASATGLYIVSYDGGEGIYSGSFDIQLIRLVGLTSAVNSDVANFGYSVDGEVTAGSLYFNPTGRIEPITFFGSTFSTLYYFPFTEFGVLDGADVVGVRISNLSSDWLDLTYVGVGYAGSPIPEPSTYGLILGGLALAGAAIRRRRAK